MQIKPKKLRKEFKKLLQKNEVILIFDGLERVSLEWAKQVLLEETIVKYKHCSIIITCRKNAFAHVKHLFMDYDSIDIIKLTRNQQIAYIKNYPNISATQRNDLIQRIDDSHQFKELSTTPIVLSMLCFSLEGTAKTNVMPANLADLYKLVIEKMLTSEHVPSIETITYPDCFKLKPEDKQKALSYAAISSFLKNKQQISENSFKKWINDKLLSMGLLKFGDAKDIDNGLNIFLEEMCRRSLIEFYPHPLFAKNVTFFHDTIQEYLTAWYIADHINNQVDGWEKELTINNQAFLPGAWLDNMAWLPSWSTLFQFLAGLLKQSRIEKLFEIILSQDDDHHHRLLLAAQCLVEVRRESREKWWIKSLDSIAERVLKQLPNASKNKIHQNNYHIVPYLLQCKIEVKVDNGDAFQLLDYLLEHMEQYTCVLKYLAQEGILTETAFRKLYKLRSDRLFGIFSLDIMGEFKTDNFNQNYLKFVVNGLYCQLKKNRCNQLDDQWNKTNRHYILKCLSGINDNKHNLDLLKNIYETNSYDEGLLIENRILSKIFNRIDTINEFIYTIKFFLSHHIFNKNSFLISSINLIKNKLRQHPDFVYVFFEIIVEQLSDKHSIEIFCHFFENYTYSTSQLNKIYQKLKNTYGSSFTIFYFFRNIDIDSTLFNELVSDYIKTLLHKPVFPIELLLVFQSKYNWHKNILQFIYHNINPNIDEMVDILSSIKEEHYSIIDEIGKKFIKTSDGKIIHAEFNHHIIYYSEYQSNLKELNRLHKQAVNNYLLDRNVSDLRWQLLTCFKLNYSINDFKEYKKILKNMYRICGEIPTSKEKSIRLLGIMYIIQKHIYPRINISSFYSSATNIEELQHNLFVPLLEKYCSWATLIMRSNSKNNVNKKHIAKNIVKFVNYIHYNANTHLIINIKKYIAEYAFYTIENNLLQLSIKISGSSIKKNDVMSTESIIENIEAVDHFFIMGMKNTNLTKIDQQRIKLLFELFAIGNSELCSAISEYLIKCSSSSRQYENFKEYADILLKHLHNVSYEYFNFTYNLWRSIPDDENNKTQEHNELLLCKIQTSFLHKKQYISLLDLSNPSQAFIEKLAELYQKNIFEIFIIEQFNNQGLRFFTHNNKATVKNISQYSKLKNKKTNSEHSKMV